MCKIVGKYLKKIDNCSFTIIYNRFTDIELQRHTFTNNTMSSRGKDVPWRWWDGETFEEEWHATSKAGGARAEVMRKYFPNASDRMSQYQKGRLEGVQLPKTKSSNPDAELMFCDSCLLDRQDHCTGFNYCVEHKHHTGQRFWF